MYCFSTFALSSISQSLRDWGQKEVSCGYTFYLIFIFFFILATVRDRSLDSICT